MSTSHSQIIDTLRKEKDKEEKKGLLQGNLGESGAHLLACAPVCALKLLLLQSCCSLCKLNVLKPSLE